MDSVTGVRSCAPVTAAHLGSHQPRHQGRRDSRLRYSSSSSDGAEDVDRVRSASRYTVDQQPSSGGGGNDSGIGNVRQRLNGNVTSDEHNSSTDRLTSAGGPGGSAVQRIYNYLSAESESDDASSGIGGGGAARDSRRQPRSSSGRRRRHEQQRQRDRAAGQLPQQSIEMEALTASDPVGLEERLNDVGGGDRNATARDYGIRQSRYRSGTDSINSSRASENYYSKISEDTLPLPINVTSPMTSSRPNLFLPPPPPMESCPPMPPRRIMTTFGTQTADRGAAARHSAGDLATDMASDHDDRDLGQTQFLVQTPFGHVFAPSSQTNTVFASSTSPHHVVPSSMSTSGHRAVAARPSNAAAQYYHQQQQQPVGPSWPGVDSRGTGTVTSHVGLSTGEQSQSQQSVVDQFGRPSVVVESTATGFVSGLSRAGFNSGRTDRVGSSFPVYPSTSDSTRKETSSGPKRFPFIAGFKVKRQLERRCNWRCVSIILLALSLILLALISYLIVMKVNNLSWSLQKQALLVEDGASSLPTPRFGISKPVPTSSAPVTIPIDQYQIGTQSQQPVGSNEFWPMTFFLKDATTLRLNASFVTTTFGDDEVNSGEEAIGIYGRRGLPPTHARYDFVHVTDASSSSRRQRRSQNRASRSVGDDSGQLVFVQYMEAGLWYVFVYNDSPHTRLVTFGTDNQEDSSVDGCLNNCNGRGDCVERICRCFSGFSGPDCSKSNCLPLCNGRGLYVNGVCRCHGGWSGPECQIASSNCDDPTCGGGNGQCVNGRCICAAGFQGANCTEELCTVRCLHGNCRNQRCVCEDQWEGSSCDVRRCDPRCSLHGSCTNGTCQCQPGWNGRHCSLDGCPQSCNVHGTCRRQLTGDWSCACDEGWSSAGCNVAMETVCEGDLDDDEDGATDCLDPDCCLSTACRDKGNCQMSPDPMEILLRKQPPSSTASFYERMKFLIEDESVQSYATQSSFNPSQVSVIRGRVVGVDDVSLVGVRVSIVTQPLYGFTLTRDLGQFDLLVNGGGSVTVFFQRPPFKPRQVTVMVPWNRMITMETVVLAIEGRPGGVTSEGTCPPGVVHDYRRMKPTVLSTWQHTQLGACPSRSTVIPESQVVKESLQIPGTGVYLVYHSSTAPGYMSIIMIQLTPDVIPSNLAVIHLKVTIEGLVSEKVFEAEASLKYKFSWDRRNAYNQKVYGIVSANVGVGYQYEGCPEIFWETRSATLSGYDISSSEIGGWNLNIHHMYNFQEGILHKGDGTNVFLKERPRRMSTILGNGKIRRLDCRGCDGKTDEARLMAPVALASGRDGSLYVGDYNYVRRINASRDEVTSILQLNMSEVPYKYYMTVSPLDGKLYISDHRSLRIFRVKTMGSVRDLSQNAEVIAGTGEQCIPGDPNQCGDGGLAVNALLFHPKGLAINKDGVLYFADGPNIRSIDVSGRITTVIGSQGPLRYWQPFHCDAVLLSNEVMLYWPTALAINPLDDTLHVLDSSMVLKLTRHGHVFPVAGRANHCPPSNHDLRSQLLLDRESASTRLATDLPLVRPQHIAFSPAGDLYIVEEGETSIAGTKSVNRIRVADSSGVLLDYVGGGTQSCDCRQSTGGNSTSECQCQSSRDDVTNESRLGAPTAVTVTPDGVVHVADMGNLRVHSIVVALPTADRVTGVYDVIDDTVQEQYTFNRFGQHVSTKHILTGSVLYNFTYNVNSYYSKLVRVSDASFPSLAPLYTPGNTIVIKRDYRLLAQDITPPGGQGLRCRLAMDNMGHLSMFTMTASNATMRFEYSGNTGLMTSKEDVRTGRVHRYEYDKTGRISVIINPTGARTKFDTDVDQSGAVVRVSDGSSEERGASTALATNGNVLTLVNGEYQMKVSQLGDRSMTLEYPFKMAVALETIPHPLLGAEYRLQARRQIVLPNNLVHRFEWRYYQRPDGQSRRNKLPDRVIGRQMKVNGETVLSFEYDRVNRTETVMDRQHEGLLTIHYDASGRIIQVSPRVFISGLRVWYDQSGLITRWNRGGLNVSLAYDERGRLAERRFGARAVYKYIYRNNSKTTEVHLPSGKQYQLLYDSNSNLRSVITPGLSVHQFGRLISPVIDRDIYWPPTTKATTPGAAAQSRDAFVLDYDAVGRLLRISYPSGRRRTVFRYGPSGHLSLVAFDQTNVQHHYHPESRKPTRIQSMDLVSGNVSFVLEYGDATEALVTSHNVTPSGDAELVAARFRYVYDDHLRVSWSNATVGDVVLPATQFEYSVETGQMVKMAEFSIRSETTTSGRRVVTQDSNIIIARDLDGFGRVTDVSFTFGSYVVFGLEIKYDELGRVLQWRRKVGSSDQRVVELVYDIDSHVTEVIVNDQSTWRYETDLDGNVVQRSLHGNVRPVLVNNRGQTLQSATGKSYVYDVDGFIVRRDDETFVWNSLGRLVEWSSTLTDSVGGHCTYYRYDSLGRLSGIVTLKNTSLSVPEVTVSIQLYYGSLAHANRVTHVRDQLTANIVSLTYDADGRLFAMHRNGADIFYVATDPHSTPIVVFSSTGGVVRQLDYDPLGSVLADTTSQLDFPLVIGYRGAIWDSTAKILFFDAGATVYDTELGSWMAPDYRNLVVRGKLEKDVYEWPQLVNFYQTGFLTHRLLEKKAFPLTDISDWLPVVGYDYTSLVPVVPFDGIIGQPLEGAPLEGACHQRREVMSAFHCAYDRETRAFSASSRLVALSSVVAVAHSDECSSSFVDSDLSSFATIPYAFGASVRTSVDESRTVGVELVGSQQLLPGGSVLTQLASVLLNSSRTVGIGYIFENGRSVDYFVKRVDSIDRVDEDLRSAGLDPLAGGELEAGVNVTVVRQGERRHTATRHHGTGEHVDVHVRGAHSTVVVRYTEHFLNSNDMLNWVTSAAKERALDAAWDIARQQIAMNNDHRSSTTSYVWSRIQREQLLSTGRVSGVRPKYVRSPNIWPEFADDPANVRFVTDD